MVCPKNTRSSNITGLSFAEEECLKQLPSGVAAEKAKATLIVGGVGVANEEFTIAEETYVLVAALSTGPAVPFEVLIGATPEETAANLAAAVVAGEGEGVVYGEGTTANADVGVEEVVGSIVVFEALAEGEAGNSLVSTEDSESAYFANGATFIGGADAAGVLPTWYGLEPNSYSDFGGELTRVARQPIDPSRQNKKGVITDLNATGGFNTDVTQTNLMRLLQGFFFADAHEKATTAPMNDAQVVITGAVEGGINYTAASGLDIFEANDLILAQGFNVPINNGLKRVSASSSVSVIVWGALADETPPAAARLAKVGKQFAEGTINFSFSAGVAGIVSSDTDLTSLGLKVGEYIFIGGDDPTNRFANNVGYARVGTIDTGVITFDDLTFIPTTESGTGKSIQIFFGTVIVNEKDPDLIKQRSYQLERTLGEGVTSTQAEYLEGAVANELTLNLPLSEKITADLAFIAADHTFRSGAVGDELKAGVRHGALGEAALNTTSDLFRVALTLVDPNSPNPDALFGFVNEATVTISNGVTPTKAIASLGAIDMAAGNFTVGGSISAYFSTVAACQAVRNNADAHYNVIAASKNAGFYYDIPLLSLDGGQLNVEMDSPITIPLESAAAENKNGYTLMYGMFPYLPSVAMPSA